MHIHIVYRKRSIPSNNTQSCDIDDSDVDIEKKKIVFGHQPASVERQNKKERGERGERKSKRED